MANFSPTAVRNLSPKIREQVSEEELRERVATDGVWTRQQVNMFGFPGDVCSTYVSGVLSQTGRLPKPCVSCEGTKYTRTCQNYSRMFE